MRTFSSGLSPSRAARGFPSNGFSGVASLKPLRRLRLALLAFLACGVFLCAPSQASCQSRILFRISLENTPVHIQTRAVKRFVQILSAKAGDRLQVELYDSAAMFRDADVFSALTEGKVEMAVPGTWHIARYQPDVNIFLLPVFYGRSAEENHAVLESDVGTELNRRIEDSLGVIIPGKWLDLGYANLYAINHPLTGLGDVKGLRIRVAGGVANQMRLEAVGADAITISWPDLPLWLDRGEVDGVLTTHETVRSAKLWENGLKFCLEDREYFPMYAPMISERVWRLLPDDLRQSITQAWEEAALWERRMAATAQIEAGKDLERHGMRIVTPDSGEIVKWRRRLAEDQDAIIAETGLDKALYQRAARILDQ